MARGHRRLREKYGLPRDPQTRPPDAPRSPQTLKAPLPCGFPFTTQPWSLLGQIRATSPPLTARSAGTEPSFHPKGQQSRPADPYGSPVPIPPAPRAPLCPDPHTTPSRSPKTPHRALPCPRVPGDRQRPGLRDPAYPLPSLAQPGQGHRRQDLPAIPPNPFLLPGPSPS